MGELVDVGWENEKLAKVRSKVFRGHNGGVNSCCFFDDDKLVLTGGDDKTLRIWNTNNASEKQTLYGHQDEITCCKCTADGRNFISTSLDRYMIVWDSETCQPVVKSSHEGMVMSCDISHDSQYILTCTDDTNAVYLWDFRQKLSMKVMKYHTNTVLSCRFAHNSYRFCTTSMDRTARVVDMLNYRDEFNPHGVLTLKGHSSIVSSCDFSSDERRICTGSWDTTVMVWDVNSGTYRKDGPLVLDKAHHGCVSACKFTKNGSALLSVSYEGDLVLWDVETGSKKIAIHGHSGWVTDCAVSKKGNRAVSSSKDGTVRYWDIESYEWLPVVILNSLDNGLRIVQCDDCHKAYSLQSSQQNDPVRRCVFCRHHQKEELLLL